MKKRVAVIGAGISGLAAIKACKEEDIDVECFERSPWIGGLWHYHEESEDGKPSVMKSTIINTHKDMTAFSDFPVPLDSPSYMHHFQLLQYFQMYAEHFQLYPHIHFHHEVQEVVRAHDFEETGQWKVKVKSLVTQTVTENTYDGIMVCTGHHAYENSPKFPGQELFSGKIVHSHSVKTPDMFKDMNVLVIGIGNSAVDVAVDLSNVAKQVYISTRRGAWIAPRCGPCGIPGDLVLNSRISKFLLNLLSWKHRSWLVESLLNAIFNHELYGLRPKHNFFSQHPTVNDILPSKILSGRIIIKRNVRTFTRDGVIFEKESSATSIDAVILATGYNIKFPFIKESFADIRDNRVNFYKLTFPTFLKHPSIGFIGLIQPNGSIIPISELQSRWFALVIKGKVKLPKCDEMIQDVVKSRKLIEHKFVKSPRHTIQVDYVRFMDEIASQFGAKPNLLKMIFTDPSLFIVCLLGPCVPYQYRLQGPHPWPHARKTILKCPAGVNKPLSGGVTVPRYSHFEVIKAGTPVLLSLLSVALNGFLILLCIFIYFKI